MLHRPLDTGLQSLPFPECRLQLNRLHLLRLQQICRHIQPSPCSSIVVVLDELHAKLLYRHYTSSNLLEYGCITATAPAPTVNPA